MSKQSILRITGNKITPDNFKLLYDEMVRMHDITYIEQYEDLCKEVVQSVIEHLIYGDKHEPMIFDLFCEYNFMNEFIYLANLDNRGINLQIIKSFAVLILNLTNTTTLYFIFSNNFINQIISNDYEKYDEDFLSYYINFIKSLSLKIDHTTIQFFFHKEINSFPLLQAALKMYNHNDPMIKNVVRNIVLTIIKIKYEPLGDYFSSLPSITYFAFLSCKLRDLVILLNDEILSDDQQKLKALHEDIIDDIMYIQDIFSLKLEKINYILSNCLFYYLILPLLCGSLISMQKPRLSINVSLYIILVLLYYIKEESFLNVLMSILFLEKLNHKIIKYMEEYPKSAKNYFFDWNAQKTSAYHSFANFVTFNFSEPFIRSVVDMTNIQFTEIQDIVAKYEKLFEEKDSNLITQSSTFYQNVREDVLGKLSNSEIDIMTTYHKNISIATGINVGLTLDDHKRNSVFQIMDRTYQKFKYRKFEDLGNKFKLNEVRENLYSYVRSKDDTLILLVSMLINIIHRKNISKELLSKAKLLKANDMVKNDNDNTSRILSELFTNVKKDSEGSITMTTNAESSRAYIYYDDPDKEDYLKNQAIKKNSILNDLGIQEAYSNPHMINSSTAETIEHFPVIFYNSYFSALFPFIEQKLYDTDLLDHFLNLLLVEPPFRMITNRLILENIKSLMIQEDNLRFIDKNHLDILNKTYYTLLSNIKLLIINNKYIRETGFEHFENEWKNYRMNTAIILEELVSQPFLLIPFNLEDTVEDYPKVLKIQRNELDIFKNVLIVFMTIHDMQQMLYKENELIIKYFPLRLGGMELALDKSYSLFNAGLEMYNCRMKATITSQFINYLMLIYQNHIYFALPDNKDSSASVIKHKYALRHIEAQIDRAEPRILHLIVMENGKYIELSLNFDDVPRTIQVKKNLEEHRKSARNTEYLLLDSYIDDLISNWKF